MLDNLQAGVLWLSPSEYIFWTQLADLEENMALGHFAGENSEKGVVQENLRFMPQNMF